MYNVYSREISPAFINKRSKPNDRTRNLRLHPLEFCRSIACVILFFHNSKCDPRIDKRVYYRVPDRVEKRGCFIRDKMLRSYIFNPNRIFVS